MALAKKIYQRERERERERERLTLTITMGFLVSEGTFDLGKIVNFFFFFFFLGGCKISVFIPFFMAMNHDVVSDSFMGKAISIHFSTTLLCGEF